MMTWQEIPGWFTFEDVYTHAVETLRGGGSPVFTRSKFVEVGIGEGRSAAFLLGLLNHSDRDWVLLVDHEEERVRRVCDRLAGMGIVNVSWAGSVNAAKHQADGSLDFVFIDADHTYESVLADIDAWLPKVRSGGILAGHDYVNAPWSGVIRAVTERFDRIEVWRGSKWTDGTYLPSWLVRVP